jgi:hypothetical protein
MRFPNLVLASALAVAAMAAAPSSLAASSAVKVVSPLLRATDSIATGQGSVAISSTGGNVTVTFSVAGLPGTVAAPLGVFLENGVALNSFTSVASIAALQNGAGKVVLSSVSSPPPALGVSDVADLVGRIVEIRDGGGTALLSAKIPALSKFVGTKLASTFGPSDGSPLADVSGKLTGTPTAKTGSEKFLVKVKGLLGGVTYTLYIEDRLGSGVFVAAGELVNGQFLRDQARGDRLPLGAASLLDLIGRAMEVRDAKGAVAGGLVPFSYLGTSWPQSHVFIIDEPGLDDRYLSSSTGIVIYRSDVDLSSVSIPELVRGGDAQWRLVPRGTVPGGVAGGIVVNVSLVGDDRTWWTVGDTRDQFGRPQHYLGIRNISQPPTDADEMKFILHTLSKVKGRRVVSIESFLYRGEYVLDEGHGLTANGALIAPAGETTQPFILR